jgi:hypothetical protein
VFVVLLESKQGHNPPRKKGNNKKKGKKGEYNLLVSIHNVDVHVLISYKPNIHTHLNHPYPEQVYFVRNRPCPVYFRTH